MKMVVVVYGGSRAELQQLYLKVMKLYGFDVSLTLFDAWFKTVVYVGMMYDDYGAVPVEELEWKDVFRHRVIGSAVLNELTRNR